MAYSREWFNVHDERADFPVTTYGSGFGEPAPVADVDSAGVAEAALPGVSEAEPVGVVDAELAGFTADCGFDRAATLSVRFAASCDANPAAALSGKR